MEIYNSPNKNHIPRGQRQKGIWFFMGEYIFISHERSCNNLFIIPKQNYTVDLYWCYSVRQTCKKNKQTNKQKKRKEKKKKRKTSNNSDWLWRRNRLLYLEVKFMEIQGNLMIKFSMCQKCGKMKDYNKKWQQVL
jgi:hypothetical protein